MRISSICYSYRSGLVILDSPYARAVADAYAPHRPDDLTYKSSAPFFSTVFSAFPVC